MFRLLLLLMFITAPAFSAIPEQKELVFDIYRNGKPFGQHTIKFEKNGDVVETKIDIDMKYKLGPITLFKYRHDNREVYKSGQLVSMNAETFDNEKVLKAIVDKQEGKLFVKNKESSQTIETDNYPTTYWDKSFLEKKQLINSQYGTVNKIKVKTKGFDDINVAGETVKAEHLFFEDMDADRKADIWYDKKTGQWVGLEFTIRGSTLTYKRVTPVKGNL